MEDTVIQDNRRSPRAKMLVRGVVSNLNGLKGSDCIIRDGNKSGCKILLADLAVLPRHVVLNIEKLAQPISCEVIWRDGYSAGLKFLGPQ